jgi:hypothetical protein
MAKLDLEDDNVEQVSVTLDQARDDEFKFDELEDFVNALDNAQARVFSGDHKVAYVVIEIRN